MAGKTVAVYDNSESYIKQFLKYVNRKKERRLEVTGFTDRKALFAFLEKRPVDILLFSPEDLFGEKKEGKSCYESLLSHRNVKEYVCFGEGGKSKGRLRQINKYQSMKAILEELYAILYPKGEADKEEEEERPLLIGVYDPAQNPSSLSAALEIAEEFSARKETLFLDFERFPMLSHLTGGLGAGNLSDLIYYYKTNPRKLKDGLEEKRQRYHNLDLLTGPELREDMEEIREKEWPEFLKELAKCGGYEAAVVYMGEAFSDLELFFDSCSQVYLPSYTDEISAQKLYLFAKYLKGKGRRDLFEKIQNIYIHEPEKAKRYRSSAGG